MANEKSTKKQEAVHDSKFDASKLIQALSEKWQGRACPLCNSGPWSIGSEIFELREFHGGNLVIGAGKIMPVIGITCDNCGNTVFLNAIKTGLVKGEGQ